MAFLFSALTLITLISIGYFLSLFVSCFFLSFLSAFSVRMCLRASVRKRWQWVGAMTVTLKFFLVEINDS